MAPPNFLLVTFPSQGHINASLRFAKRLVRIGCPVNFTTNLRRISHSKRLTPEGFSFVSFLNASDDGTREGEVHLDIYMEEIGSRGPETLRELILDYFNRSKNFTSVFFSTLVPWVADVARTLGSRSTLVWVQPVTVFDIYFYYFNGYDQLIRSIAESGSVNDTNPLEIQLPGMIPMTSDKVPSDFISGNQYAFSVSLVKIHFEILNSKKIGTTKPKVLVNTFDELDVILVGLLIPLAFLTEQDPTDTSFGGNRLKNSCDDEYIDWLNKQPMASVIYRSFGSLYRFTGPQKEEMGKALLATGRPFLWVIRKKTGREEDRISCEEELSKIGIIAPVLSNPTKGCNMTHCGWNLTVESLAFGVPTVAFPQWSDQWTNAKLVEDVWRTGVLAGKANGEDVVEAGGIGRCMEVMFGDGEKGRELRGNATKWRKLAMALLRSAAVHQQPGYLPGRNKTTT